MAQLRLSDDGAKGATAVEVRRLTLPTGGNAEDGQSEGLVVDAALGRLYVAMEDGHGILAFGAEPDAGSGFEVVHGAGDGVLEPDLEGLAIYHGAAGGGYLLASSQGDDTVAVFDRGPGNAHLGSFALGGTGSVDSTEESDGIEVSNVSLGSRFPRGLLVVHDGNDDPQHTVIDGTEIENAASNFKLIGWDEVAASLDLAIDTRHDPRRGA